MRSICPRSQNMTHRRCYQRRKGGAIYPIRPGLGETWNGLEHVN
jgi:hypothetical protein